MNGKGLGYCGTNWLKDNDYETPKKYWEIIAHLIPQNKLIWEAFYCAGRSGNYLRELGFEVDDEPCDFFERVEHAPTNCCVVSNPPYSGNCIKNKILKKLIEKDLPFILLMPISTIAMIKTQRIIRDRIQIIIPNIYLGFIQYGKPTIAMPFYCCYICHKMNLKNDITFLTQKIN